jgi:hypothetical protein
MWKSEWDTTTKMLVLANRLKPYLTASKTSQMPIQDQASNPVKPSAKPNIPMGQTTPPPQQNTSDTTNAHFYLAVNFSIQHFHGLPKLSSLGPQNGPIHLHGLCHHQATPPQLLTLLMMPLTAITKHHLTIL